MACLPGRTALLLFGVLNVLLRNQWNSEVVSLLIERALGKHNRLPRWIPLKLLPDEMAELGRQLALCCVVPRVNSWI